jgi:para-nitrobenzyl esterase
MGRASDLIAERKSVQKQAPVYFYQLSWNTPVDQGKWRSPHTLDVPLVFDNVALVPSMFGGASSEAHQIAESMSEAWLAFARTGNPNTRTLIDWPAYDTQRRRVMDFNLTSAILEDPFGQKLRVLSTVPDWDGREGI